MSYNTKKKKKLMEIHKTMGRLKKLAQRSRGILSDRGLIFFFTLTVIKSVILAIYDRECVQRTRRCCEEAKESLKVMGTRERDSLAHLSFGEICGNSRGRPEESNFIENFTAFHRRHFMGRTFYRETGARAVEALKFSEATDSMQLTRKPGC